MIYRADDVPSIKWVFADNMLRWRNAIRRFHVPSMYDSGPIGLKENFG
jgi:hypothetical protein